MSDCGCFPGADELARLAENAQAGRTEAFVGTGHPDTVLACPDGGWRLGDILDEFAAEQEADAEAAAALCGAPTNAGTPCKRTPAPGSDRCAKHPGAPLASQAQAEGASE